MSQSNSGSVTGSERPHAARAFDIRNFIATLLGLYGIVLLLTGLFGTSDTDITKAQGVNVNLWTGIAMLLGAAALASWARLRPVVVPPTHDAPDADRPPSD